MSLQHLTGGDQYPQERTVIADTGTIARPIVEVVEQVTIVEATGDGPPVVEVGDPSATGSVLHVVEPVIVNAEDLNITLDELADVQTGNPQVNRPQVFVLHPDGVWRPEPLPDPPPTHTHWGDEVRFGPGPPPEDPAAPVGSFWADYTTGQLYEKGS